MRGGEGGQWPLSFDKRTPNPTANQAAGQLFHPVRWHFHPFRWHDSGEAIQGRDAFVRVVENMLVAVELATVTAALESSGDYAGQVSFQFLNMLA